MGILFLVFNISTQAQTNTNREVRYSVDNGLPSNTIFQSIVDKHGFIWMGASGGIVRFDGKNAAYYNRKNTPVLKEDDIANLRKYNGDTLLFYCNTYISDEQNYLVYEDKYSYKIVNKKITDLCFGGLTPSKQFATNYYKDDTTKLLKTEIIQAVKTGFFSGVDLQHLYVYIKGKMYYIENGQYQIFNQTSNSLPFDYVFQIDNRFVHIRTDGYYGVFTPYKSFQYKPLPTNDTFFYRKIGTNEKKLYRIKSSENLFTDNNRNVYAVRVKNDGTLFYKEVLQNIDISNVSHIYYKKNSNQYILSTYDEGLKIYNENYFNNIDKNKVVPQKNNFITSMIALPNNKVFTSYGILNSDGTFYKNFNIGLNKYSSSTMLKYGDDIYLTKNQSLIRYHIKNDSEEIICPNIGYVSSIYIDINKKIWITTREQVGYIEKDSFIVLHQQIPGNESGIILRMTQINKNYIEVISNLGVFSIDIFSNKVIKNTLFGTLKVLDIYKENNSTWWIATYGDGYYRFKNKVLTKLPLDYDQNLIYTQNITDDGNGWLWYSTNNGIMRVNKNDLNLFCADSTSPVSMFNYSIKEGLISSVLYGNGNPSVSLSSDGIAYYPTIKGLTFAKLKDIPIYIPSGKIFFDNILINSVKYGKDSIILDKNFKNLSITVSIPYLGNPSNLNAEYLIKGFSNTWNKLDNTMSVLISSLPSGTYELIVRYPIYEKAKNHSVWCLNHLTIKVLPAFYQKTWFILFCIFVLFGIFFIIYKSRLKILIQRKKELEQLIDERTKELQSSIQGFQLSTEQLYRNQQVFDSIFSTVLHDLGSPLRFLNLLSDRLKNKWKEIPEEEIQKDLEAFNNSTVEASHIAQDLLLWLKTQKEELEFKKESIEIGQFIQENTKLYKWIAEEKGLKIALQLIDNIYLNINPELLGILYRNIIDNAVKYTRSGFIYVTYEQNEKEVILTIEDSGKGFTEKEIQNLNIGINPFKVETGGKLGFKLIFDVLKNINGKITFQNKTDKGLKVVIYLPK